MVKAKNLHFIRITLKNPDKHVHAGNPRESHVQKGFEQADPAMNMIPSPALITLQEQEPAPVHRFQHIEDRVRKYFTMAVKARNGHLPAHTSVFTGHKNDDGSDAHILVI
jgi:hypothetical protein